MVTRLYCSVMAALRVSLPPLAMLVQVVPVESLELGLDPGRHVSLLEILSFFFFFFSSFFLLLLLRLDLTL